MKTRIRIATPFGTEFKTVPQFLSAQPTWQFRQQSTLQLHYPRAGVNSALLNSECEAVFEYWNGTQWVEPLDSRFRMSGSSRDRLEQTPTKRFDFKALIPFMLDKAYVWEPAGLPTDTDGNILFAAATPGTILRTLILNARARGWGSEILVDFTSATDSNGQAWAGSINLTVSPEQTIGEILYALGEQGVVDWAGQGRTLRVFNPDNYLGRRLTQVRLASADGETSAPEDISYEDRATVLRVLGEDGATWDRPNGVSAWGRLESIQSAGGVADEGTAFLISDEELLRTSQARISRTREFDGMSEFLPHRDFRGGDWVQYQTDDGFQQMRVFSVSLTIDDRLSGHAVLGDRFEDKLIAAARKQKTLVIGNANGGNGQQPSKNGDTRTPANPIGFLMSSSVYLDNDGAEIGRVSCSWTHTGKATDGTAMDIDRFEFRVRVSDDPDGRWESFRGVDGAQRAATFSPVRVRRADGSAEVYDFQIRAVGANSRFSPWVTYRYLRMETDTTPPPVPSTPSGVDTGASAAIAWDGFGASGEVMPPDFLHVEAELGMDPETGWQFAGNMESAGSMPVPFQLAYGTFWIRLRSVDHTGNKSEWSALGMVELKPLVELPDIADLIDDVNTQIEGVRKSANGANTRTDAITDPVTTGEEREGDSWFKWTEGEHVLDPKILLGTWVWNNGGWQKYVMGHQVIGTVDAGAITVGFMDGIHVKSRTLHIGDQIVVADMNNLATINAQLGVNVTYPASWTTEAISGYTYKAPGGSDYLMFMDRGGPVPVEAGDWIRVSFTATTGLTGSAQLRAWFYANEDGTGGTVASTAHAVDFTSGERSYTFDVQVPSLSSIGGGKSWVMGLFGADSRWVGVRNVRVYKKVNATLIGPNSIQTPHLGAKIIESEHLKSNIIEADMLKFGFADGKIITGTLFQSLAMPNRGFKIDGLANRMYAWNSLGQRVFMLNGDNGDVTLGKGDMIRLSGSTGDLNIGNGKMTVNGATGAVEVKNSSITGASINGGAINMRGTGAGIGHDIGLFVDGYGMAVQWFNTPNSDVAATIRAHQVGAEGGALGDEYDPGPFVKNGATQLVIRSPKRTGVTTDRLAMWLQSWEGNNGAFDQPRVAVRGDVYLSGAGAYYGSGNVIVDSGPNSILDLGANSNGVRSVVIRDRPYTGAANVYVTENGYLGQTSSASRFKLDQRVMDLSDSLLEIPVKDWIDKTSSDEVERLFNLGVRTEEQQSIVESDYGRKRTPGVVAEDVESVDPRFATYDADGLIQGVAYDRLAMAQIAVLNRQLTAERERNDALEERITRLEKLLTTK